MEIEASFVREILTPAKLLKDVSLVSGSEVILDQLGGFVAVMRINMINEAVSVNMLCEVSTILFILNETNN